MDSKSQEIYSELSAFLDSIDEERRNKIPEDLRELINSKKDNNYTPKYPKGTPLEKLKMKKETKKRRNSKGRSKEGEEGWKKSKNPLILKN